MNYVEICYRQGLTRYVNECMRCETELPRYSNECMRYKMQITRYKNKSTCYTNSSFFEATLKVFARLAFIVLHPSSLPQTFLWHYLERLAGLQLDLLR